MQLRVGGHAPVAASLRAQRYRDVPLMANHGLSKMVTTLPSHSVGLVLRIMQL